MNLQHRSYQPELLDKDDIPFADIRQNMQELNVINTRLGGHRITVAGLQKLIGNRKLIHICEIGCGGGDNLATLKTWCDRKGIAARFTGIDIKPFCIAVAKENTALQSCTEWIVSDYRQASFSSQPDIIFSSLFCHHFTDGQLAEQLRWMRQNAAVGCFINDLHRHPLAYYAIQLLTRLFSKSYLVKNDAPLSVARGFKRNEWKGLLQQTGIEKASVEWQWAFRWLVCFSSLNNNQESE